MSGPSTERETTQNADKRHTPILRMEIQTSDPAGNRTQDGGLEGKDSTDRVTATNTERFV